MIEALVCAVNSKGNVTRGSGTHPGPSDPRTHLAPLGPQIWLGKTKESLPLTSLQLTSLQLTFNHKSSSHPHAQRKRHTSLGAAALIQSFLTIWWQQNKTPWSSHLSSSLALICMLNDRDTYHLGQRYSPGAGLPAVAAPSGYLRGLPPLFLGFSTPSKIPNPSGTGKPPACQCRHHAPFILQQRGSNLI